jgi:hypothetical protein
LAIVEKRGAARPKDLGGAAIDRVYQYAERYGSCGVEEFLGEGDYPKVKKRLKGLYKAYKKLRSQRCHRKRCRERLKEQIPEALIAEMGKKDYLYRYMDFFCRDRKIPLKNFAQKHYAYHGVKGHDQRIQAVLSTIHSELDRLEGAQPIGVTFCKSVLWNRKVKDSGKPGLICGAKGAHSAVVMGRRRSSTGDCQLLVRDSSGKSCRGLKKEGCKDGQFWITDRALAAKTSVTLFFRPWD